MTPFKKARILVLVVLAVACQSKNCNDVNNIKLKNYEYQEEPGYVKFICENYDDGCWQIPDNVNWALLDKDQKDNLDSFFIRLTYKYLDTATAYLPIVNICFIDNAIEKYPSYEWKEYYEKYTFASVSLEYNVPYSKLKTTKHLKYPLKMFLFFHGNTQPLEIDTKKIRSGQ